MVPPLEGRWAMFTFEDPVAIELSEDAGVLSGLGCYGGLPTPEYPELINSCQKLSGTADGRHVQFAFGALHETYAANVFVSADGQRMAGDFHDLVKWHASAFTWLRIGPDAPVLSQSREPSPLGLMLEAQRGTYQLEGLVDRYGEPGYLGFHPWNRTVAGTLGTFWETELAWNEAEQTLVAGPVAETAPDLATQLTLHFESGQFASVDAVFPSGETRTLQPVR